MNFKIIQISPISINATNICCADDTFLYIFRHLLSVIEY